MSRYISEGYFDQILQVVLYKNSLPSALADG